MNLFSVRHRHISAERQKLNDIMLEVQRLRGLVARAEAEASRKWRSRRIPPKKGNLRLIVDASAERGANRA